MTLAAVSAADMNARAGGDGEDARAAVRKPARGRTSMAFGLGGSRDGDADDTGSLAASSARSGVARRMSVAPNMLGATGRPSLGGGALNPQTPTRRGSLYKQGASNAPKKDPRPIGNKEYTAEMIEKLIMYMMSNGYTHPLSPKLLMTPTGKEFANMISFLFRKFDPNFKLQGKIEDEVPLFFKRLRYPFPISKNALYAVGSPHTWPAVLGALTWMVELLTYREQAEAERNKRLHQDAYATGQKVFFEFTARAYQHFLAGEDEQVAAMEEQLRMQFQERDKELAKEVAELEAKAQSLRSQLKAEEERESPVVALEEKKRAFEVELDKLTTQESNLRAEKEQLEVKLLEHTTEAEQQEAECVAIEAEIADLKERIAAQDIRPEDVEKMNFDRRQLEESLEKVREDKDAVEKEIWEVEAGIDKKVQELELIVAEYNEEASKYKLVPQVAKRAEGVNLAITLTPNLRENLETPFNGESAEYLKEHLMPALQAVRERFVERAREVGVQHHKLMVEKAAADDRVREAEEELKRLEGETATVEAKIASMRADMEVELERINEDTVRVQGEIEELKREGVVELERSERELAEATKEYDALSAQCTRDQQRLNDALLSSLDMLMNHKAYIEERLEGLQAKVQASLEVVRNASVPSLPPVPSSSRTGKGEGDEMVNFNEREHCEVVVEDVEHTEVGAASAAVNEKAPEAAPSPRRSSRRRSSRNSTGA